MKREKKMRSKEKDWRTKRKRKRKFSTKTDFHWLFLNPYPEEASNYIYTKNLWNLAMCNPRAGPTRNKTFFFLPPDGRSGNRKISPKGYKGRSKPIGINRCIRKGQSRAILAFKNKKIPHMGDLLLGKIWSKWLELWQWTFSIPQGSIPPPAAVSAHHTR